MPFYPSPLSQSPLSRVSCDYSDHRPPKYQKNGEGPWLEPKVLKLPPYCARVEMKLDSSMKLGEKDIEALGFIMLVAPWLTALNEKSVIEANDDADFEYVEVQPNSGIYRRCKKREVIEKEQEQEKESYYY